MTLAKTGITVVSSAVFYIPADETLVHFCETQASRHGSMNWLYCIASMQIVNIWNSHADQIMWLLVRGEHEHTLLVLLTQ